MSLISVIIPYLNEADGIIKCCGFIDNLAKSKAYETEVIFVDDGSTDNTSEIIAEYNFLQCEIVKIITLSKNFGSHAAIRAGIKEATGDYITYIGADLQEPPDMIEKMLALILDGYDAIYIERAATKRSFFEKAFSSTFSALMRRFAVKNYGSGGINNIMFNRKILEYLNENQELNSSLMLQIVNAGFRYSTLKMDYLARTIGKSKWTFSKKMKLFIDSFVAFSFMPIRLVSIVGILMALFGFVYFLVILIGKIVNPASSVLGFPTLVSIMLLGFGITNISLGIIAEYLWRTYDSARKRPVYIISDLKIVKSENWREDADD